MKEIKKEDEKTKVKKIKNKTKKLYKKKRTAKANKLSKRTANDNGNNQQRPYRVIFNTIFLLFVLFFVRILINKINYFYVL